MGPILEAGSGLRGGSRLPPRVQPGADRPRQRDVDVREHAEGRLGRRRSVARGGAGASSTSSSRRTVPVSGTREAELTKLLENTFRHVNIALVNELAMFARDLGIDVWEAIDAASTKPFGYMRFTPGPGVGGHCLPIDPSYLSWQVERSLGQHLPVRRAGQRRQRAHARLRGATCPVFAERPRQGCQRVDHPRLGLAYKANTSDARETPSRPIITQLGELGARSCWRIPTSRRTVPTGRQAGRRCRHGPRISRPHPLPGRPR